MNKHCKKDDFYFSYLDNLLPAKEKNAFEEHLKDCASCANKLEKIKSDLQLIKNHPELIPKQNSWMDLLQTINKTKKSTKYNYKFKLAWGVATLCICLFITLFFAKSINDKKEVALKGKSKFSYVVIVKNFESEDKLEALEASNI